MGVGELNNSYEDAELADVIWSIGSNAYENQTNYFLNHWVPEPNGGTVDKKKQRFPDEAFGKAKAIFVDPRRTVTVGIAEQVAGKDNVLHLDIQPGTDIALFNTLFTYVVEKGWIDKRLHRSIHQGLRRGSQGQHSLSLEEGSRITGVPVQTDRHRPQSGPTSPSRPVSAAHHARLREGNHLGQRQLPDSVAPWSTWCSRPITSAGAARESCAWAATRRATRGRRIRATPRSISTRS